MYEPRFTYNGFRHVIVSGLAGELRPEDVEACAVQSDFATIGGFSCSDNTITRLVRMACNSYRVNFANGFPTDCAHREKLGWTGDGWMASEFAQFHFENTAAYEKWLQDIIDTQLPNGRICAIAPTDGWGYDEYAGPTFDLALAAVPFRPSCASWRTTVRWRLPRACWKRGLVTGIQRFVNICRRLSTRYPAAISIARGWRGRWPLRLASVLPPRNSA